METEVCAKKHAKDMITHPHAQRWPIHNIIVRGFTNSECRGTRELQPLGLMTPSAMTLASHLPKDFMTPSAETLVSQQS